MPAELRAIQSSRMVLTQQFKQSLELLQLPSSDLLSEISHQLDENPLLEMPDEQEGLSPEKSEDTPSRPEPSPSFSGKEEAGEEALALQESPQENHGEIDLASQSWGVPEDENFSPIDLAVSQPTLSEHLLEELSLTKASPRIFEKTAFLIEELDDDGFLPITLTEAAADFSELTHSQPAPESEWQEALHVLQHLDPAGIGASSPQESLKLQLDEMISESHDSNLVRIASMAKRVVAEALPDLARNDFLKLRRLLSCSDEELTAVRSCILMLSPRPAAQYKTSPTLFVVPDIFITQSNGRWVARLNPATAPRIRVNQKLAELFRHHKAEHSKALSDRLADARSFVHSITQRYDTILKVAQAIVSRQQSFFFNGEIALVPMIMKDIADITGLHESTISRAVNGKYLLSPRGTFELKHFFSSHVSSSAGETFSSKAIKVLIREFVSNEACEKPLSDAKLTELLHEKGYPLARRTVAKYREQEGIPAASLRKRMPFSS